jgi:putative hemolysin
VIGVVRTKDLLTHLLIANELDLHSIMLPPFYVPETAIAADVLRRFKLSALNVAVVVGEYGGLEGIVTLNDIVEEVLGDLDMQDVQPMQRTDGSWLIDGQYPILDLSELLEDFQLPEDERPDYHTMAGFVLKRMGRIPEAADIFDWGTYIVEVVDMDGQRVDKVLISTKVNDK